MCAREDLNYDYVVKNQDAFKKLSYGDTAAALEIYAMAKDELGKAKGGSAYNAVKRMVKRGAVHKAENFKGVWEDAAGRQCACDGYMAVRMKKHLDGFETVPGMDLEKVFPNDSMIECELPLPTPGELKINKRKLTGSGYYHGECGYDFGDGLPMVNAAYLKDIMDILPGAKAYATNNPWRGDKRVESSAIIFRSEAGDGILLPIRKRAA